MLIKRHLSVRVPSLVIVFSALGLLASCAAAAQTNPCSLIEKQSLIKNSSKINLDIERQSRRLEKLQAEITAAQCRGSLFSTAKSSAKCIQLEEKAKHLNARISVLKSRHAALLATSSDRIPLHQTMVKNVCAPDWLSTAPRPRIHKAVAQKQRAPVKNIVHQHYAKRIDKGSFSTYREMQAPEPLVYKTEPSVPIETQNVVPSRSSIVKIGTASPRPANLIGGPGGTEKANQPVRPYQPDAKMRVVGEAFFHGQSTAEDQPVPALKSDP